MREHFLAQVDCVKEYRNVFEDLGFDATSSHKEDGYFQFHLYLCQSLGVAASHLATVDIWMTLSLMTFSVITGLLAFFLKIEFSWFMEPILITVVLSVGLYVSWLWYNMTRILAEDS